MLASERTQSPTASTIGSQQPRDRHAAFLVGFAGWTLDAFDFFLVVFCLTDIGREFQKSDVTIALAITVTLILRPVGALVFGLLADRYGRRKVLVVSQIGTLVGFVLLAMAGNLTLVFLARIIDGLTSGNISVAHAYAAEHSAPATRKQALGMTSGAIGTGLLLGPALSSFLVHYGQTAPVWAAAALSLVSIFAVKFGCVGWAILRPPKRIFSALMTTMKSPVSTWGV